MDVLSDILVAADVSGCVFSRAELTAPWGVSTRGGAGPIFHLVLEGSALLEVEGRPALELGEGDLAVLVGGQSHTLRDRAGTPSRPIVQLPTVTGPDGLTCLVHGAGGHRTHLLCGSFRFAGEGRELLMGALPPILHHRARTPALAAWLQASMALVGDDLRGSQLGSIAVATRTAEILLVQALRGWIASPDAAGWLGALADPRLARALQLLHLEPGRAWTVEELARRVGMSRSAFFQRFGDVVGEGPLAYLTRWRMLVARRHLRSEEGLAQVAERVGYTSEAAFSRAFKRHTGQTPGAWRRANA